MKADMERRPDKKIRNMLRKAPLWERVRMDSFPVGILTCYLIRGFFDHHYGKQSMAEEEWDAQRDQRRSYLKFLEHYEAAGLLSCECSTQWQIMGEKLSRKRVTKTTQYQEIFGKKVNWEMTD